MSECDCVCLCVPVPDGRYIYTVLSLDTGMAIHCLSVCLKQSPGLIIMMIIIAFKGAIGDF